MVKLEKVTLGTLIFCISFFTTQKTACADTISPFQAGGGILSIISILGIIILLLVVAAFLVLLLIRKGEQRARTKKTIVKLLIATGILLLVVILLLAVAEAMPAPHYGPPPHSQVKVPAALTFEIALCRLNSVY